MALREKLSYLNQTKSLIRQAIVNKGVMVTDQDTFRSYADKIDQIDQGGADPEPTGDYRVRFFDYDGTYKDVWVNSGESAIPPQMPDYSQEGILRPPLTFQEWNVPYGNITRNLETGAIYIPTDEKTHLYFAVNDGGGLDVELSIGRTGEGTLEIDWGDGTSSYTTSLTGNLTISHNYATEGIYHCTISLTNGEYELGHSSSSSCLLGDAYVDIHKLIAVYVGAKAKLVQNSFAGTSILKATIPKDSLLAPSSFAACRALRNFILPNTIDSIDSLTLYSLENIIIPPSVTTLGSSAFASCENLRKIVVPESVLSIGQYAFSRPYGIRKYLLYGDTVKTLQRGNAFDYNFNFLIFVPDNLVNSYKSALYWSSYSDRILPMSEEGNWPIENN